jgi:hypothetical protein
MNDITKAISMVKTKGNPEPTAARYAQLSELIKGKYRQDNDLMAKFLQAEQNPPDETLREALDEALITAGADRDEDLNKIARELIELLERPPIIVVRPAVKFSASGTVKSDDYLTFDQADDDW